MNKDFAVFLFGCVVLFGGWFITTKCHAGEHTIYNNERCFEITPGVYKCYTSDGSSRTLIKI